LVDCVLELSVLDGGLEVLLKDLTSAEAGVGTKVDIRVEGHS